MTSKSHYVYQFKVMLKEITPTIWRRFQVPEEYSFWDFHVSLQDVVGWTDSHLHQFEANNPKTGKNEQIGIPEYLYDGIEDGRKTLSGRKLRIRDYFSEENRILSYLYDFGDGWDHLIEYECILFRNKSSNSLIYFFISLHETQYIRRVYVNTRNERTSTQSHVPQRRHAL